MTSSSLAPVREKQRIQIIDAVRGVALLGILMMNIPYFSNPEQYENLLVRNETSGINYYTWWIVEGVFSGTMRAMFSMLFGAGCILLLTRLEKRKAEITPADVYYRRLIILFLFGLINAFVFLWPGDILYGYAVCGLFLYPFRNLKPKYLLYIGFAFLFFAMIKGTYNLYGLHKLRANGEQAIALEKAKSPLNESQVEAKKKWLGYQEKNSLATLRKEANGQIKGFTEGNYFTQLGYISGISALIEREFFYEMGFFDIMFMVFLGMGLFKLGVLTGQRPRSLYWVVMIVSYAVGLSLAYWRNSTIVAVNFDNTLLFDKWLVAFNQPRRLFMALGHLSLIMLVYKYGLAKAVISNLAKIGQMAFSNYLMQSIICVTLFCGFGFGLFGKLQRYQEYYVVGAIWLFQVIFTRIWLHYYRFGPFEWVWRSLTYWQKQPMKRAIVTEEAEEESGSPSPAPAIA